MRPTYVYYISHWKIPKRETKNVRHVNVAKKRLFTVCSGPMTNLYKSHETAPCMLTYSLRFKNNVMEKSRGRAACTKLRALCAAWKESKWPFGKRADAL